MTEAWESEGGSHAAVQAHDDFAEHLLAERNALDVELDDLKAKAEETGQTNTVGIDGGTA